MSCVAEPRATAIAHQTTGISATLGSVSAMQTSPPVIRLWASSSQLRLRPKSGVSSGIGIRSTSGDQAHLKAYTSPTQLKNPMVARSTPASRSQKLSVPNTKSRGSPAEKPSDSMRSEAGSA